MNPITFKPIGIIHSPFNRQEGTPIQPAAAQGARGHIEIFDDYIDGICDLDGFSHIYLLFHLHLSESYRLKVKPYLDNQLRGVFATRAPGRPNPIGLSVVKLLNISGNRLEIENVDIIDGTPLLDIKPYVPEMNAAENMRIGWLTQYSDQINTRKADDRFK
ncbi:MAG: tRNA (N6-threonylcarbamoyladenosine(37)-N6)-methyltransferase TrmO [Candidatus Marinimicrobia bacterium]|nr:tRNA (N6-threonylcarbamoyladenosine(37)-N6)-methyltransferase TrmO [Candidatus Neomarinimicrobiota bacterium]